MEEYLAETEDYRGHKIKIYQDPEPKSPREWDNLGTMVCFHKRYDLGDKHGIKSDEFGGWDDIERHLIEELGAVVVLPLYLYDHSGITMRTGSFHDRWDSGQVGFVYVDRDSVLKEYGKKRLSKSIIKRATNVLESEVKTYDQYLTGQVYGFMVEDADGEQVDSCWGYFDEPSDMIKECKSIVDHNIEAVNKEKHFPKVEVFVTKTMKFRARIRESVEQPSYEVSVGGEEWGKGKGRNHEEKVVKKMSDILTALGTEFVTNASSVMLDELQGMFGGGGGKGESK